MQLVYWLLSSYLYVALDLEEESKDLAEHSKSANEFDITEELNSDAKGENVEFTNDTPIIDSTAYTVNVDNILQALNDGTLFGQLHLGSTKEELVIQFGEPVREDVQDEEIQLEYADAIYSIASENGLIYSATIQPVHSMDS